MGFRFDLIMKMTARRRPPVGGWSTHWDACGRWRAGGAGARTRAFGDGARAEAAIAYSGKNPIRNKTSLDRRRMRGAAHGGRGGGAPIVLVAGVVRGFMPGCLDAREQAGEQHEDQRLQPRGKAQTRGRGVGPKAGAQAGGAREGGKN